MPYDINHDPDLCLHPQDPEPDPGRFGRLQEKYLQERWPKIWTLWEQGDALQMEEERWRREILRRVEHNATP